jgi:hypothetical protein
MVTLSVLLATVLGSAPAAADVRDPAACPAPFWRRASHFASWQPPYAPGQKFGRYFENAFPGKTLRQVLARRKGRLNALGRQAVASMLNAALFNGPAAPGNYVYSIPRMGERTTYADEVITFFNNVYPGTDARYRLRTDQLKDGNRRPCPLRVPSG